MKKVVAMKDLWTDDEGELLVLAGTTGVVIGREPATDVAPAVLIISFADGNATFCVANEICEVGV